MTYKLTNPPDDKRERELWLQHAAGFIIFQDMRQFAIDQIPDHVDEKARELIVQGIDDAVYGMMMIMDGVTGSLRNDRYLVSIGTTIKLESDDEVIQEINTFYGDGMCMGFVGWKENDFGEIEPATEE